MNKTIELTLRNDDPFFTQLKEKIIAEDEIGWGFKTAPISSSIISSTIQTLKSCLIEEGKKIDGTVQFSFEHNENIYPSFHSLLEENIDISLSRRIHTTTLETLTELVENFLVNYADLQVNNKNLPLFDEKKEIQSITSYITANWDGLDKFDSPAFFQKIWDNVNVDLKNNIDQYAFSDLSTYLLSLKNLPNILINNEINSIDLAMNFIISYNALAETLKKDWDFEKKVNSIISTINTEFPDAKKIKPKGWNKLAKNYIDYAGMNELNNYIIEKFTGMNSGTACSFSFDVSTALPHVMYDDKCQNRKPLQTLVGAIVGHAYVMNEKNNTHKIKKEWSQFKTLLEEPGITEIKFTFEEPLNQALFNIMKTNLEVTSSALKILGINNRKKIKP